MALRDSARRLLMPAIGAVMILTPVYYVIAERVRTDVRILTIFEYTFGTTATVLVGYLVFFTAQALSSSRRARRLDLRLDHKIPFVVHWVWVYGVLYYLLIGLPIAFLGSARDFTVFILGGFSILLLSVPVFILWPRQCPPEWRIYPVKNTSSKYLKFIQEFDNGRSCLPSLHCALAAYASTFVPSSIALLLLPGLIGLSCLFVKQHALLDLPPGLTIGFSSGLWQTPLR